METISTSSAAPHVAVPFRAKTFPSWLLALVVFAVTYVFLFLSMSGMPGAYDEGLVLTAAFRVASGQIPHQDFYAIYGPANFYILAAWFNHLSESLLIERLIYDFYSSALVALLFLNVRRYTTASVAACCAVMAALSMFAMNATSGIALFPASLLNITSLTLVLYCLRRTSPRYPLLIAGLAGGLAALFRYDTGVGITAVTVCVLGLEAAMKACSLKKKITAFLLDAGLYLGGLTVAITPAAFYYRFVANARFSNIYFDVIGFPAHFYRLGRSVPFPAWHTKIVEDFIVYALLAILALAFLVCMPQLLQKSSRAVDGRTHVSQQQAWFLFCFAFYALVMYVKGLVRISFGQIEMATLPAMMILALLCFGTVLQRTVRQTARFLAVVLVLCVTLATLRQIHTLVKTKSTLVSVLRSRSQYAGDSVRSRWCAHRGPLTTPICFIEDEDRAQAMMYIEDHTTPADMLYVGTSHHDRIFANDNMFYFATQRLPATHWSHFDPYLQNSASVQGTTTAEMERKRPPFAVLSSEFDKVHEANGSSLSSGVTILDAYLQQKYAKVEQYGRFTILKRID